MSEAKFTKGKWGVTSQFGVSIGEFAGSAVFTQNTGCVTSSVVEREANAHLIAAAPDMYDYLDGLYQNLCSIGDDSETVAEIRKLLAKARGEHV